MFSIIRLKFEFANMTRTRGAEYLQEKRVSLLESTGHSATLFVQAEERFQVVVQAPKGQRVTATCTCQFFKGGNKCKHIWASYLYLEENRIFEVKPEADVPAVSTSTSSEPQNWMKSFSSFLNSEEKHQADLHHFIDDQNDSKVDKLRSGVYTINAQKTKLNDKVFLNLLCQEMKKDGTLSVIKSAGESEDTIPLHGNPVDQEILSTLLGPTKEGDTGYYSRSKTNSVTIQPRSVNQILAQISDAGRLYIDFTK
ncbi:MAG: SWIM zinc finger domain-containing protein [Pseudobdellovibrionaceae bacterium]